MDNSIPSEELDADAIEARGEAVVQFGGSVEPDLVARSHEPKPPSETDAQ